MQFLNRFIEYDANKFIDWIDRPARNDCECEIDGVCFNLIVTPGRKKSIESAKIIYSLSSFEQEM